MPPFVIVPLLLATAVTLVPPGVFRADQVEARDGQAWLALHTDGSVATLVPARLRVLPVEDAMVDAPGERSALEVSSAEDADVLMYLRGTPLQAGPVEVAEGSSTGPLSVDPGSRPFTFRGAAYRIQTHCDARPMRVIDGQEQYGCSVVLHAPTASQALSARLGFFESGSEVMSFGDDGAQRLLFAGDLDRDGKLDIVFDTARSHCRLRPTLFLSSHAAAGALLGEVAHHQSSGC